MKIRNSNLKVSEGLPWQYESPPVHEQHPGDLNRCSCFRPSWLSDELLLHPFDILFQLPARCRAL